MRRNEEGGGISKNANGESVRISQFTKMYGARMTKLKLPGILPMSTGGF